MRLRGFPVGNKPVSKTRKGGEGRPFVVALADAIVKGRQSHRRSGNGFPLRRTRLRRPDHRRRCRRLPVWRSDPAQRSDFASQIKVGLPRASALSPRRPINRRRVFFPAAAGRICKQIKKCCAIQQYLTRFGTGGCSGQRGDMAHGTIFVSVPHMGQQGIDVCAKRAVYISQRAGMKRAVFSLFFFFATCRSFAGLSGFVVLAARLSFPVSLPKKLSIPPPDVPREVDRSF